MNNEVNRALVAKKPSFKTTTLIAAIGMIMFTLYVTARYIIQDFGWIHYHYSLGYDIRVR